MPTERPKVVVLGGFDDLRSTDVRFLQEAARRGAVEVLLLSDRAADFSADRSPAFPVEERQYLVEAIRYVSAVRVIDEFRDPASIVARCARGARAWAVREADACPTARSFCESAGLEYVIILDEELEGFPAVTGPEPQEPLAVEGPKRAIVTGCYDWLHSGHVRFFEEVSELAELYVTVGSDRNIEHLKGEGHPLYSEEERRYLVGSIRYVKQAMVATGWGWLDAEPEIERIRPDIYAVNEDGDRPEKREFCESRGIEYRVLRRLPRPGLPARQSTDFRGF
ncbi:MAG: adenylyltransferase/cytidyltransferase family protein [Gemmatimonadota bacterium]